MKAVSIEKHFIDELKDLRALHRMTQKEFAHALGISPQYLYDLECGRRNPSVKNVASIVRFLQLGHRRSSVRYWNTIAARTHGWDI